MGDLDVVGSLQVAQDLKHERREWRIERIGWIVMALVLVAAMAGLFGSGPLAHVTTGSRDETIRMEYDRFARAPATTTLDLEVDAAYAQEGTLRVFLSREYVSALSVKEIQPEPASQRLTDRWILYAFDAAGDNPLLIRFTLEPQRAGPLAGTIGIDEGPQLAIRQWIYP